MKKLLKTMLVLVTIVGGSFARQTFEMRCRGGALKIDAVVTTVR